MENTKPASGNNPVLSDTDHVMAVMARLDGMQLWIVVTALEAHERGELTFQGALDRIKSECAEYDARSRMVRGAEAPPRVSVEIPLLNLQHGGARYSLHVHADLPGLPVKAGMVLDIEVTDRVDCDAVFHLADGSLARMQSMFDGTYRVTRQDGTVQIVPCAAMKGQVQGRWVGQTP